MLVVLEVLLVRPFLKVGWGFLRAGPLPSIYEVLITLEPIILSGSLILVLISAGLAGYLLIKDLSILNSITSIFLFGFLVVGILSVFTTTEVALLMAQNIVTLIVITFLALRFTKKGATKIMQIVAAIFTFSYFAAFWFGVAPVIFAIGGPKPTFLVEIFNLGEVLAIVNVLPLYFLFRGHGREKHSRGSELVLSSIPAILFIGAYLANPALTSLFSTWVFGYTLFLPFPIYAAALWLYANTIIRMLNVKEEVAYGLIFIFLAGRNLQSVYLTLIAILGIFLIISYVHLGKKVGVGIDQGIREQKMVE